jgi:AcrR family transcriptional regulator
MTMVQRSAGRRASRAPAAPAGGRRERRKLEVYRRIHQAAVMLFRRQGYEATTVEQIAERADVAKGTVFNYFPSKESLLLALSADVHVKLVDALGPATEWQGTCRQQIGRLLLTLARLAQADRVVFRLVLNQNIREFWRDAQRDPLSQFVQASVRTALRTGRVRGELNRGVAVEPAARLIEAALFTTLLEWLNGGITDRAFGRELDAQLDIVFVGIGRRP